VVFGLKQDSEGVSNHETQIILAHCRANLAPRELYSQWPTTPDIDESGIKLQSHSRLATRADDGINQIPSISRQAFHFTYGSGAAGLIPAFAVPAG